LKIAIVEISKSHEECIHTQVKFLKNPNHTIDLIVHKKIAPQLKEYHHLLNKVYYHEPNKRGFIQKLRQQKSLSKKLAAYDIVIFNTASSSKTVRNTSLFLLFSKVKCLGVLHNAEKLTTSFTQAIISFKIKKYFVLNDTIASLAKPKKGVTVASFYPIFFPKYDIPNDFIKPNDEIWITIPGRIDWERRDYKLLVSALKNKGILGKIKFILLGKLDTESLEGYKLWNLITQHNLEHYFLTFNTFISNKVYHAYLMNSDYIMPLLSSNKGYLQFKISGSFNLAFAYKKKLLCKTYFKSLKDLQENAFFYDSNGLHPLLKKINNRTLEKRRLYQKQKWNYEYQKNKYISFLFQ